MKKYIAAYKKTIRILLTGLEKVEREEREIENIRTSNPNEYAQKKLHDIAQQKNKKFIVV
ncbi:hypothetical protein GCM10020331_092150 [Ectobacillus funiculus]